MKRFIFIIFLLIPGLCSAQEIKIDYVLVKKSERLVQLLSKGKVVKQYHIALGANPRGHKQQEGDEKTPEGRYILDYKKENSSFFRAIHISYPNQKDIEQAKLKGVSPGGQIMIHGQKNGLGFLSIVIQNFDWTDGCIAVSNAAMKEIWSMVRVGTTIEIQ